MFTASGGGGLPDFVTGDGDDPYSDDSPIFDDWDDLILRRIEYIREHMPQVVVIKTLGKIIFRVASDLGPIHSDPDVGPPFITISEGRRAVEALDEIIRRGRLAAIRGGTVVPPSFFGVDP